MKNTLADAEAAVEIVARFNKLTPENQNHWGTMQVTEMLLHCTLANQFVLDDNSPYRKPTVKESLKKFACFHIITKLPHNRKGPARLQTKNKIDKQQFDLQKQAAIDSVNRFAANKKPINSIHAAMGCLTFEQWGIITWMHMDHHLRQFGV